MAKKIRFPLTMADGAQVRSLEELREHFDLESVLEYYKSGKLLTWLQDRYFDDEAAAVEALDEQAPDFQRCLCEALGVPFSGAEVDLEEVARRQERLEKLRQYTDDGEVLSCVDLVAFDQEELADLLDEDAETIYLCGEMFTVPASKRDVSYVGVNMPKVHIGGKVPATIEELGISFSGCNVDNLPVQVAGMAASKKKIANLTLGFDHAAHYGQTAEERYYDIKRDYINLRKDLVPFCDDPTGQKLEKSFEEYVESKFPYLFEDYYTDEG